MQLEAFPTKAAHIKSLLLDREYRSSEIAKIVNCGRPYVSRIKARMRRPLSRYGRLEMRVETLWHECTKLREQIAEIERKTGT